MKTPSATVRGQCKDCLCLSRWDRETVLTCQGDTCLTGPCPIYPYRGGKRIPVKVFRAFCKHCLGGQGSFIKNCSSIHCRIYPYRFGTNPSRQGIGRKGVQIGRESLKPVQGSTIPGQGIN